MDTQTYRLVQSSFTKKTLDDFLISKGMVNSEGQIQRKIFKLADTTTATSGMPTTTPGTVGIQGALWFKEIIKYAEDLRRFDQAVMHNEYMVNTGAREVMIPRSTSHLDITDSTAEGADRTMTAMDNLSTTAVTMAASDFKKGGVTISKELAMTSMVDLVAEARYKVTQHLAKTLDTSIVTEFQDSSVTNRVFGGSGVTDPSGLATGDILTTDLVADARAEIEENDFVPKILYIAPAQMKAFRKDSQFVNAAEYGSNEVVLKGEVGNYLGLKVITTTNAATFASGATDTNQSSYTWGAAGHCCMLVGTNGWNQLVSGVVGWKEKPNTDYDYNKYQSEHRIYANQAFKVKILEPKAMCLIKVTDA